MPPYAEETMTIPISTLKIKPPPNRSPALTGEAWLKDKQHTDGAEGLWRVHDGIYDLTEFVKIHPGGSDWLDISKGTDITEAFEAHHLTSGPNAVLKKYFVRQAQTKRNSPFTFHDNGFYRTLKREVVEALKKCPEQVVNTTTVFTDGFLVFTFLFAILATNFWSYKLGILAGIFLAYLTISAHNYTHRKDNFRMHYLDFSLMSYREWRVTHVLSHHLHTNTIDDLEISNNEPFLQYLPVQKSTLYKYTGWIVFLFYCVVAFILGHIKIWYYKVQGKAFPFRLTDLVPYILPLAMYIFGGQGILDAVWMWIFINLVASTHFAFIGFTAAHHHPDIFHDGDTPRSDTDYDWGIAQLDALMDRKDITGSHFLVLTHFGDHGLHHLFPTLDHGALVYLYPTFKKVCKDFNVDLRFTSQIDMAKGSLLQLIRTEPNPNPPDLLKKYD